MMPSLVFPLNRHIVEKKEFRSQANQSVTEAATRKGGGSWGERWPDVAEAAAHRRLFMVSKPPKASVKGSAASAAADRLASVRERPGAAASSSATYVTG